MVKQDDDGADSASPAEGGRRPSGAGEAGRRPPQRFWAQHKTEAVLRLLRGEDIEIISRELGVTAARLTRWRDKFLASGAEGLKKRPAKEEAEIRRLKREVAELRRANEILKSASAFFAAELDRPATK